VFAELLYQVAMLKIVGKIYWPCTQQARRYKDYRSTCVNHARLATNNGFGSRTLRLDHVLYLTERLVSIQRVEHQGGICYEKNDGNSSIVYDEQLGTCRRRAAYDGYESDW
jgi:hypothetical protein